MTPWHHDTVTGKLTAVSSVDASMLRTLFNLPYLHLRIYWPTRQPTSNKDKLLRGNCLPHRRKRKRVSCDVSPCSKESQRHPKWRRAYVALMRRNASPTREVANEFAKKTLRDRWSPLFFCLYRLLKPKCAAARDHAIPGNVTRIRALLSVCA